LYDSDAVENICAKSLQPLGNKEKKRDPFVKATYSAEYQNQVDEISGVSMIGAECLGLKIM